MITVDFSKLRKSGNEPGWFNGVCPACGKKKFYINIYTGQYLCFRESCHIRGSFKEDGGSFVVASETDDDLITRAKSLFDTTVKVKGINLDQFSIPLSKVTSPFGYLYIQQRGFSDSDIQKYKLRVGIEYVEDDTGNINKQWKQRIIFPYYEKNIPFYAIGRTFADKIPKYLNTKLSKSVILYNHENIKDSVIICEGLLSAIAAEKYSGIPAVPLLGTFISDYQAFLVGQAKNIYISLDGGVDYTKVYNKIKPYAKNIYFVNMPKGKDPDELKDKYAICFKKAKLINNLLFKERNYV